MIRCLIGILLLTQITLAQDTTVNFYHKTRTEPMLISINNAFMRVVDSLKSLIPQKKDSVIFKGKTLKAYRFLIGLMITNPMFMNSQIIISTPGSYTLIDDLTPPSKVQISNVMAISDDSILVTWNDPADGDLAKIEYRWNGVLDSVNKGVEQLYFTGLTAETYYYIDFRARDDSSNWSAWSDTVGVYTPAEAIPDPPFTPSMIIYMPSSHVTTGSDSLGTLVELQNKIDSNLVLPGASIRFEKGGTWTARGSGSIGLDLSDLEGTADSFVTFETYGTGNKPRFDFTGTGDMFKISGTKYVEIDGLAFYPSATYNVSTSPRFAIACMDARTTSDTIKYIEVNNCLINNVGGGFYINSNAMVHNISFLKDSILNTRNVPAIGSGDGLGCGINIRRYVGVGYQDTVTVDSCVFVNNGGTGDTGGNEHGIYFGASNKNLTVTNSTFSESPTNGGGGVTLAGGSNITIANNTFTNLVKGVIITPAQANSGRIDSVYIYNNVFSSTSSNTYAGIDINALTYTNNLTNYVKIYNNLFDNFTAGAGINVENIDSLSNVLIANNTLVNCIGSAGAFRHKFSRPNWASNNRMLNNIFFNNVNDAPLIYFYLRGIVEDDTAWTSIDYNLYYKTSGSTHFNINETKYTSVAAFKTATFYEDNGLQLNPYFADVDDGNYHLTGSSPLGYGYNLTSEGITVDFKGQLRIIPFDMGYDEYAP